MRCNKSDLFNPELYVSDVSVYYGSKCAVQNVSFNIHPGQLTAIIGNNGCGKTSLTGSSDDDTLLANISASVMMMAPASPLDMYVNLSLRLVSNLAM